MTPELTERITTLYPALLALPPAELSGGLGTDAQLFHFPANRLIFDEGAPCQGFPMVLSGGIRVARGAPSGRRLELYRVTAGELCVVSTSCLFGQTPLSAHGQTTAATDLVLLSPQGFERWCQHAAFQRYVWGVMADRLADLVELAEAIAFQRLDQRLAHALLGRSNPITATHQELADQLGTVRETVSRLLRRFESLGWVRVARERTEVVDAVGLRAAAQGPKDT